MDTTTRNASGPDQEKWDRIAGSEQFQDLLAIKKLFIVPAFVFFLTYYVSLSVLVGYAPRLMHMRVLGTVNLAYLFALSQFVVGWVIAGLYLIASAKFDLLTKDILSQEDDPQGDR